MAQNRRCNIDAGLSEEVQRRSLELRRHVVMLNSLQRSTATLFFPPPTHQAALLVQTMSVVVWTQVVCSLFLYLTNHDYLWLFLGSTTRLYVGPNDVCSRLDPVSFITSISDYLFNPFRHLRQAGKIGDDEQQHIPDPLTHWHLLVHLVHPAALEEPHKHVKQPLEVFKLSPARISEPPKYRKS